MNALKEVILGKAESDVRYDIVSVRLVGAEHWTDASSS